MYPFIRTILFAQDSEKVHYRVMNLLSFAYSVPFVGRLLKSLYAIHDPSLSRTLWGITFPNPVGLAAGFDKDARFVDPLACLGFGFVEIGTVTPQPQAGNPKPRLFRLVPDRALINRMGFNNRGAAGAATRLEARRERIIVGGNIGKNKDTPNEKAGDDYEACLRTLSDAVDYFVVNVSSPNTPGLRELQDSASLSRLLSRLQAVNKTLADKPILLKIAPDLSNAQIDDIITVVRDTGIAGIVATNTTLDRSNLTTSAGELAHIGNGGLSGLPLQKRSTEIIRYIHEHAPNIPLIASGGIFTPSDAIEKIQAGAALVQVYSGFIYEGPSIVKDICRGIGDRNKQEYSKVR